MDIEELIVTLSARQHWKDFLLALSKEELAELLLEKMVKDSSFSRELFYKFLKLESSVGEVIIEYETAVKNEMIQKVPDVEYLRMLSKKVMLIAETEENLLDKSRLYSSVIKSLESAIDYGAGYENEDEDILFELVDECRNLLLPTFGEKC